MRLPTLTIILASVVLAAILASPSFGDEEIGFLTYNIYYGGVDHDPVFGRDYEWLDVMKSRNPDVIFVQEANGWLPMEEDRITACVESLNAAFPLDPPYEGHVAAAGSGFHVAIISRLPVLSFEAITEIDLGEDTVFLQHVFAHAELDVSGETIHAIGVHFKPGDERTAREREARGLLAILDGIPLGEKVWIGGDCNSYSPVDCDSGSPTEPDYFHGARPAEIKGWEPVEYLLNRQFIDAFRTFYPLDLGYTQNTESFYEGGMGNVQRVDFLLQLPGNQWNLISSETLNDSIGHIASDHYAVYALYRKEMPSSVDRGVSRSFLSLSIRPNPVVAPCAIQYTLPVAADLRLSVYSLSGRLVRDLTDGRQGAGFHTAEWDGTDGNGRFLPSGIYFVRLSTSVETKTARLVHIGIR